MVRRILITGCSGSGKSSLLAEMAGRGHDVAKEPGARVIRAEDRMGGNGLPWGDAERFARLCLKMAVADWESARIGTMIFDRGVLDAALALKRLGQDDGAPYLARYPYDPLVILAPPWEEIFASDTTRRHDFAAAIAEYEDIAATLPTLGYAPELLPQADVAERADWLESLLKAR